MDKKPILVTGSHRSGTTWVGRMIAKAPDIMYVHEPFNCNDKPRLWSLGLNRWFKRVTPACGNVHKYQRRVEDLRDLSFPLTHLAKQIKREAKSLTDVGRLFRDYMLTIPHRIRGSTPLFKDPIALLSAEWLEEVWNSSRIVVMIRHPAAFAGSLKEKNWTFPFDDLLGQEEAIEGLFREYKEEIRHFAQNDKNIVDQAGFLWVLLYSAVREYQERHSNWIFLRHEDVVKDPIRNFREIYNKFDINFTHEIRNQIEEETDHSVVRNWKKRLSSKEALRVKKRTKPIVDQFYEERTWGTLESE